MKIPTFRTLIINFIIELAVYGVLIVIYFLIVLKLLRVPLSQLYHNNLIIYAFLGLGLIIAQGVLLEWVTSFLLNRLKLERLE
jgi:hypothetical protein